MGWEAVPSKVASSLESAWNCGVPPVAQALHGRWWQLETWLRSLVYVELRARFGDSWLEQVPERARSLARSEARLTHMTSPDSDLILAYADLSHLFEIIERHWDLFESSLIQQEVWKGRIRELKQVRHRIAHFRRPHADDLARVEQTLRDLDAPAVRAMRYYNDRYELDYGHEDPVAQKFWGEDRRLARLVRHADRSYSIVTRLCFSRRPWARPVQDVSLITGEPGYLWHARFYLGARGVIPRQLWLDEELAPAREGLIFLCLDGSTVTDFAFSALSSPDSLAISVEASLRSVMSSSGTREGEQIEACYERPSLSLDPRVQIATPWAFLGDHIDSLTMFGA
ncbi:Swt1 family HEPN domain-containing protein [Micromonospora sp. NPDC048871]|uniref:Swt1 family HEPN domain-containing protein n=1 Tax=Micromonospora sp. NPDC048871 TaxID=3364259 RepID=UPI0037116BC6